MILISFLYLCAYGSICTSALGYILLLLLNKFDNQSFILDIKIIFMTILKVLKRDGINQEGEVTSDYFNGYN